MNKKMKTLVLTIAASSMLSLGTVAVAEPFIGEIAWVPYNFAPRGWAFCDGQLLDISQNTALFSLLGTTYGGNGRTDFAVPDVRSRTMVHAGTGPGLSQRRLGEKFGSESVILNESQMPSHNHALMGSSDLADDKDPTGNVIASQKKMEVFNSSPNAQMDVNAVGSAGGSQAHENMQPSLVLHCIIALEGIFPSRN